MTKRTVAAAVAFGLALLALTAAKAAEPQTVAAFKDWSVFVRDVDGDRICFAASEAKTKAPSSVNHGDIFFLIATWKSGAATNQPSFMAGYNLNTDQPPTASVGAAKFAMYVSENEAFIESAKDEQALITAMRSGANLKISAVSSRGTATSYVFSLQGLSSALDKVRDICK